jgi:hypothetical protein
MAEPHETIAALLAAYDWVDADDPLVEALSITLAQPDDGRVPDGLSPRRELAERLDVAEALHATLILDDFAWGAVLAQIDVVGPWAVIIEPNGWAASMPDVLGRLSADGVAVNVFWNVNAVTSFSYARNGELIREFDGLLYDWPADPIPEEIGFPWGPGRPRASMLGVMERLTGVRLGREWLLTTRRRTFEVPLSG